MMIAEVGLPQWPFTTVLTAAVLATVGLVIATGLYSAATSRKRPHRRGRILFSKLIYMIFLGSVVVLAGSSFGSMLQFGHMSGYALLAHIAAAGAFVFLLLAIAWLYLPRGDCALDAVPADGRWWLSRWSAWMLVTAGIVTAATMFISMLPILGTEGLIEILVVHRYAGLLVVLAAMLHLASLAIVRVGAR